MGARASFRFPKPYSTVLCPFALARAAAPEILTLSPLFFLPLLPKSGGAGRRRRRRMASPSAPKFDGGSKVFDRGSKVEVSSSDPGFTGAWFEATVVRCGVKKGRLSVDYDRIVSESDPSKPHHEVVDLFHVRPRPPPPPPKPRHFLVGDKVEGFYHDCWWAGEVHQVLDASSRYVVRCVDGDVLDFSPSDLRPRLDWVDRKWVSFPNPLDMVCVLILNLLHYIRFYFSFLSSYSFCISFHL